jgi:tetrahydromethanopterin S-methyltransferase subunit G
VSKLTGRNSTVIRQATQKATEKTADQLGRDTSLVCGLVVGWICSVMASPEDKRAEKSRSLSSKL